MVMADTQIFIKLLDNKTLTLQFPKSQNITLSSLKHQIQSHTQIPPHLQTLTHNGKLLITQTPIIPNLSTLSLTIPLCGGKGGFGSLLRGAATKAGQKKTNNFDACRDMSGRRLRHVNAEKRLEEWKAGEEERKLEKKAEKYLKEREKKGKGGRRDDGAEKYVEKYREVSAKCVEEVELSVREAGLVGNGRKRKGKGVVGVEERLDGSFDAKKLKIWMGKRKMGESDSDDSESDDSDTEKEKSVVIDNGNQSDSSKDATSGPISAPQVDGDQNVGGSSDTTSEDDKETVDVDGMEPDATPSKNNCRNEDGPVELPSEIEEKTVEKLSVSAEVASTDPLPVASTLVEPDNTQLTADPEVQGKSECKSAPTDEVLVVSSNASDLQKPLNFDDFNSSVELEALGMERLKSELQERGLKCGGTLQERAARLFLLKTTPLEKLPKKLLAKKP